MKTGAKAALHALFFWLFFGAMASAGPLEDATVAYKQGDYATALSLLRPLAEQGNAAAQNYLGLLYDRGHGVPQDSGQAMTWYRKAAEGGSAEAQYSLGAAHEFGFGAPRDEPQAASWYRKAAEQGFAEPQLSLGIMYDKGRGVPRDVVQAYMWMTIAAARLPAEAQAAGHPPAAIEGRRKRMLQYRDVVAAKMTAGQIAEAERLAREWQPKSK